MTEVSAVLITDAH